MSKLLDRATRILAQRDHSEQELRRKLAAQSPEPHEIDQVIEYCYQHQWLDDTRFAMRYLQMRSYKGYGILKIKSELMQRGISSEIFSHIDKECQVNWLDLAQKIAERRFGVPLSLEWSDKLKIQRFLIYRGFTTEQIRRIFC